MRESRSSGSVRGAASDGRPYRELIGRAEATGNSRATLPFAISSEGREVGAKTAMTLGSFNPIPLRAAASARSSHDGCLHGSRLIG